MICPICKQRRNHPAHTDACSRELQRRRKREIELGWDSHPKPAMYTQPDDRYKPKPYRWQGMNSRGANG